MIRKIGLAFAALVLFASPSFAQVGGGGVGGGVVFIPPITAGHCAKWLAANILQDAGAACGTGSGSGTVTSIATNAGLTGGTITTTGTIGLAAIAADNLLANSTGGSAAPIATAIGSCSAASSALTYNTSTHAFGCNSISAATTHTLTITGNVSAAAWTTSGVGLIDQASSYTDTSSSGTVATAYSNLFGASTILASSSTTYTNYYGSYFVAPAASTNVTMTNAWALGADSLRIGTSNQLTVTAAGALNVAGTGTLAGTNTISAASAASVSALIFTGAIESGGSGTTNFPHFFIQGPSATASTTWSTTGTAIGVNAHTSIGNFLDFKVDGATQIKIDGNGAITTFGTITGTTITAGSTNQFAWTSRGILTSSGTNAVQLGATDAATAAAETLSMQNISAGHTNVAGGDFTIRGSLSNGSGTSDLVFQTTANIAASGTQNTGTEALRIKGGTQLVQLTAIITDATKTDATVCEDTTAHALYSGSGTIGICLGTSTKRAKQNIATLDQGVVQLMRLAPIRFNYKPGWGFDPKKLYYGFLAEDVVKVLPKLVDLGKDGKPNSVDVLGMVPILVKAVQEQQGEILTLKVANDNLSKRISLLERNRR